jgi:flavin reductase (DIM6/NTAB) family NADH-FMN oxidoreductase RutF
VIIGWARGPDTGARRFRFSGPPAGVVEQAVAAGVALAVELLGASSDRPGDRDRHPQESEADLNGLIAGLDYPVFVVTAQDHGEQSGCLVGFATQASLDPQRLLVCLSVVNHTYGIARNVDLLGVHVLRSDQHELASLFGGTTEDRTDKFAHCRWERGPGDVPLLSDCAARMVGRVLERIPLGDHVGFLLAPIQVERAADGAALTYQDVKDLRPGHPA